jgi:hypothetical protein
VPFCSPHRFQPRRPLHPHIRAGLGYLALVMLFYLPQLLGLRAFPDGDFNQHFLAFSLFQRAELLAGRLPVWNPYTYGGHPFLADVQAAVFYPISNLVLWLTIAFGSTTARLYFLEVEAALHMAMAGSFTYLLVQELTGRRRSAFLAGAVFTFSGYLTGYPPLQLAVLRTAVWLPLVLWLWLRAFNAGPRSRWRWTVYAALAYTAAFLAGHSQTFLFLSYTVAAWLVLLFMLALVRPHGTRPATRIAQIAVFGVLFLALSAAQLWPSLEFTQYSVRANVDYTFVSGGFPLSDTWQMLVPGVLTTFSPLFVGSVALGLALLGLAGAVGAWGGLFRDQSVPARTVSRAQMRACAMFFATLGILALLVSFGDGAFLYPLFYRWLPGWNLFRGQERAAYLVAFSLSVLAGYGAASLEAGLPLRYRRAWVIGFGILVVTGTALFAAFWAIPGQIDVPLLDFWRTVAVELIVSAALILVCLRAPDSLSQRDSARQVGNSDAPGRAALAPRTTVLILLALVLVDLFLANYRTDLGAVTLAQAAALRPEIAAVQGAVQARPDSDLGLPGRVHNEYRVYDDYGMAVNVEDVWGSSPLKLARYAVLFDKFPMDRMWRLLGVEHVLTWQKNLRLPSVLLAEFPQAKDTTYLHRLDQLNPRAWLVHQARWADDTSAAGLLADHAFNLDRTAVLGAGQTVPAQAQSLAAAEPVIGAPGADSVRLSRLAPDRLIADVKSEHGGLLVVSENWLPGWQATRRVPGQAGGERTPVLRADLTLLALPVPAGESTVELAYRPTSIYVGLAISAAALLILLLGFFAAARRRQRPTGAARI